MRWSAASLIAITVLASPLGAREPSTKVSEMMPLLASLAEHGAYGIQDTERGAFIVRDRDGELQCVLWPATREFQRASVDTPLPEGLVAIAHTHPRCCREVSGHDRREAIRLAVPVVAVSMGTLSLVDEHGKAARSTFGISWSRLADPRRSCVEAGQSRD